MYEDQYTNAQQFRDATSAEIREAVEAYKEGVLEQGPKKYRVWVDSDAPQVQLALALQGKDATITAINGCANQMGLT